jgi:hypothetical protein
VVAAKAGGSWHRAAEQQSQHVAAPHARVRTMKLGELDWGMVESLLKTPLEIKN